jgi:hypothetical protein
VGGEGRKGELKSVYEENRHDEDERGRRKGNDIYIYISFFMFGFVAASKEQYLSAAGFIMLIVFVTSVVFSFLSLISSSSIFLTDLSYLLPIHMN